MRFKSTQIRLYPDLTTTHSQRGICKLSIDWFLPWNYYRILKQLEQQRKNGKTHGGTEDTEDALCLVSVFAVAVHTLQSTGRYRSHTWILPCSCWPPSPAKQNLPPPAPGSGVLGVKVTAFCWPSILWGFFPLKNSVSVAFLPDTPR